MIKPLSAPRYVITRSFRRLITRLSSVQTRRALAPLGLPALVACLAILAGYLTTQTSVGMYHVFADRRAERVADRQATHQAALTAAAMPTPRPTRTPTPAKNAATAVPSFGRRVAMLLAGPTPTPTATPEPKTQRIVPADGQTALYVPGGTFTMGRPAKNGEITSSDQPAHKVTIGGFWMGRTPVTNAMYAACVEAGGCTNPIRKKINPHYYDPKFAEHPVVYVVWQQAVDYCAWAGGRLPTEAEWERAARGNRTKVTYAWGMAEPNPKLANLANFRKTTVKVGSFPKNASPYGVLDMGTNVREWVSDWFGKGYYRKSPAENPTGPENGTLRAMRGAAWHDKKEEARVTRRYGHAPDSSGANRGFRCAFDVVPED